MFCKKRDNLLVKADIFYHFRGIILCNVKRLQFHLKTKKNLVAQIIKSSIQLRCTFYLMELLVPFEWHLKNIVSTALFLSLMVAE